MPILSPYPDGSFTDPQLCRKLLRIIQSELDAPLRFMEVCGTHTSAIYRSGLNELLPKEIEHISGPGCPACVIAEQDLAAIFHLAKQPGVILTGFGDLMHIPNQKGETLSQLRATGTSVKLVYSPLEALALAKDNPHQTIIFLAMGFETTAPTTAGTILQAAAQRISNFHVLSLHKLMPPVLRYLLDQEQQSARPIDAFLLPGHVAVITGIRPFLFIAQKYHRAGVVAGFAPADILQSLVHILKMRKTGKTAIMNQYSRAAPYAGNPHARQLLRKVFIKETVHWRGLGPLAQSGLGLNPAFKHFDAQHHFGQPECTLAEARVNQDSHCAEVLQGKINPKKCPLFGDACTPEHPVGPGMISSEGSCAVCYLSAVP